MYHMNKMFQKVLVVGAALSLAATTFAADIKLGFVDLKKVFDKYYKTVQSSAAIKEEVADVGKERKEMIDTITRRKEEWHKLLDKANDQAVSADERDRSKKAAEDKLVELKSADDAIQEFDKVSQTKIMEKERQRRDSIVAEIRSVLDAKAKVHGYSAVLDTSGDSANYAPLVLFYNGDNDLTDELLKELNAAAPAPATSAAKPEGLKLNEK
jgi:Skp family chaperone for outer membrane proteins